MLVLDAKTTKAQIEGALNLIPMEIWEVAVAYADGIGESLEHFVRRSILETIEMDRQPSCVIDDGIPEVYINYLASRRAGGGANAEGRPQTSDNDDL